MTGECLLRIGANHGLLMSFSNDSKGIVALLIELSWAYDAKQRAAVGSS
jgi:hypothetical protein